MPVPVKKENVLTVRIVLFMTLPISFDECRKQPQPDHGLLTSNLTSQVSCKKFLMYRHAYHISIWYYFQYFIIQPVIWYFFCVAILGCMYDDVMLRIFLWNGDFQWFSHVGNAMGYIRMIRSGGLHCCSNAIRCACVLVLCAHVSVYRVLTYFCLPSGLSQILMTLSLSKIWLVKTSSLKKPKFQPSMLSLSIGLCYLSILHSLFDSVIANLSKNFSEGNEYFKVFPTIIIASARIHSLSPTASSWCICASVQKSQESSSTEFLHDHSTTGNTITTWPYWIHLLFLDNELCGLHHEFQR